MEERVEEMREGEVGGEEIVRELNVFHMVHPYISIHSVE